MQTERNKNEAGMVSILVTMILIIVITLIVIGFAQVARHNQREALDSQLSTQAYYAAESGANAAVKYFQDHPTGVIDTLDSSSRSRCTDFVTDPRYMNESLNAMSLSNGVSFSCLMVNSKPPTLIAAPLTQDSNIVWHLEAINGASDTPTTFNSLTFTWANNAASEFKGGSDRCDAAYAAGNHSLPQFSNWDCSYGLLRVDLVDVSNPNQATLGSYTNTKTIFMIPNSRSGNGFVNLPAGQVAVGLAKYDGATKTYSLTVNGVTGGNYYARLTMLYQSSGSVTLSAGDPAAGIRFEDGQAVIDSTGKAQDEVRRVQYRIPLKRQTDTLPNFGIQSTDAICKQALVGPNNIYDSNCRP